MGAGRAKRQSFGSGGESTRGAGRRGLVVFRENEGKRKGKGRERKGREGRGSGRRGTPFFNLGWGG